LAEVTVSRDLFWQILNRIKQLDVTPPLVMAG